MILPNSCPNVRLDRAIKAMDKDQELQSQGGRSVQAWQCFDGSISSIDSLSEPLAPASLFHKSLLLSDDDQDGSPQITSDQSADEGMLVQRLEEPISRVKLMCSFGGRILPRPSDGKLRYVGGDTRIVSVHRGISYGDLMLKMKQHYGEDLALKYQLPNEDLDSLISVSNDEDLQNMMEEYDRLEAGEGLQRLRVLLFSTLEDGVGVDSLGDPKRSEQWYVEAVNGILEGSSRRSDGGFSGGRLSARPSAENLISLDGFDSHGPAHLEEAAGLKKHPDVHGAHGLFSGNSSPSLLPQRHSHPYAMLNPEQFALYNPDVTQNDLEHYCNTRPEMAPEHGRGYNVEGMLPRVGSHGKLSRLQEHEEHDLIMRGYNAEPVLPHVKLPPRFLEHDDHEHFSRGPSRAGSHGKLSRLQEDPQQSQEYMMEQQRQRFMHQQYIRQHSEPMMHAVASHGKLSRLQDQHDELQQDHSMEHQRQKFGHHPQYTRQHALDEYRRQDYESGYVQQHQPPLHYHEPTYRQDHYQQQQQHHRHPLPDETYIDGHMYHGNGMNAHPHSSAYQAPSSPRVAFWDGRPLHQQHQILRGYEPRYREDFIAQQQHLLPQDVVDVLPPSRIYAPYYQQDGGSSQRDRRGVSPLMTSRQDQVMQMEHLSLHQNRFTGEKDDLWNKSNQEVRSTVQKKPQGADEQPINKCSEVEEQPVPVSPIYDTGVRGDASANGAEMVEGPACASQAEKLAEEMVSSVLKSTMEDQAQQSDKEDEDGVLDTSNMAEKEAISRDLQIIKNSDLEEIRELGSGTYGTVYYGKWRGTDVAIKRIKSSCFLGKRSDRERLVADFWREAHTLSQLKHPNVVAFYGVVPDGPDGTLATVTEYMVNGSLKQVLQKKDRTVDRRKRLMIAMEAAFGMEYLHEKKIVHFDLKCENLLVNMRDPHRPICKVGDLGLSKVKRQTMVSGGVRGTLPWMAPELLQSDQNGKVSEKVDVFSFGIVMWELLTGEDPYASMHHGAIIAGILKNELRPEIPQWCEPSWRSLMEKCWAADPTARPTFSDIASELRAMTEKPRT